MRGYFQIQLRRRKKGWRCWVYYPKAKNDPKTDGREGWVNYDADTPELAVRAALGRLEPRIVSRAKLRPLPFRERFPMPPRTAP